MIITYHEIVDKPSLYAYAVAVEQMREHLAVLNSRGKSGLPETDVTFDDGLSSHYRPGADLLDIAGLRGSFFVTPGWTGSTGYMDVAQLRDLAARGHDIQSHGWSHKILPLCAPEELRIELIRSKEALEDWLGREVDAVALPGGACNRTVLRSAAEAGYRRVYTSYAWLSPAQREGVLVSGRLMLRNSTTGPKLESLLATEGRLLSAPRLAAWSRHVIRTGLGLSLYHRLWLLAAGWRHVSQEHPI